LNDTRKCKRKRDSSERSNNIFQLSPAFPTGCSAGQDSPTTASCRSVCGTGASKVAILAALKGGRAPSAAAKVNYFRLAVQPTWRWATWARGKEIWTRPGCLAKRQSTRQFDSSTPSSLAIGIIRRTWISMPRVWDSWWLVHLKEASDLVRIGAKRSRASATSCVRKLLMSNHCSNHNRSDLDASVRIVSNF
jgi:hypothetical protein